MGAEGQKYQEVLKNNGFSDDEVNKWSAETTDHLAQNGFSQEEVKDYFGVKDPDISDMKAYVKEGLNKQKEEQAAKTGPQPKVAEDWTDSFLAGWQMSSSGLTIRQDKPDMVNPEHAGRIMEIASTIGSLAGDLPAMVAGGVLGGVGGFVAGGPVASVIAGDAAANALPTAMKKIMMDHYEKGDIKTPGEFFDRLASTTWETLKSGAVGAATMGAGRVVGPIVGQAGGKVVGALAKTAAEIGTMTTAASALEGHLPKADDFINAGIVVGGLGASLHVAGKLRGVYAEGGAMPHDIIEKANEDVVLKQSIVDENPKSLVEVPKEPVEPPENPVQVEKPSSWRQSYDYFNSKAEFVRNKFYSDSIDDLHFFKVAGEKLSDSKIPAGEDPYILSRIHKDWEGKLRRTLGFNTLDFKTGKANGEGLMNIFESVPDKDTTPLQPHEESVLGQIDETAREGKNNSWGKLTAYLVSKRAIEKESQGIKTGVDLEAANKVVSESEKEYAPIAKRISDFQDRVLQYAVDSGIVDTTKAEAIRKANKDYVPFGRLQEEDPFSVKGKGKSSPLKRMTGSETKLLDPLQVMRDNTAALIKVAEKNRILKNLVELQEKGTEIGKEELFRKVPSSQRPVNIDREEVGRFLNKHGVDEADIPPDGMTIFRPISKGLNENEFQVFRDGKREVWAAKEGYADAVKALDYHAGTTGIFFKIAKASASGLRLGATMSPDFQLRNIFRDQLDATIQSKHGHIPFANIMPSIKDMFHESEAWQSFMSSGAATGALSDVAKYFDHDVWGIDKEVGFIDKSWNTVKNGAHGLEVISSMLENVSNLDTFKKAGGIEGNFNERTQAAFDARESKIDFARAGAKLRAFSAMTPFFNAGVQGNDRMIRAFKENPAKTSALAIATITVPTLLNWWANKDDSRFKTVPRWQRDLSWVIPMDKWQPATSYEDAQSRPDDLRRQKSDGSWEVNNGAVVRVPKPFFYGITFGSSIERVLDAFYEKDPNAFKSFNDTIISGLVPNVWPTAALPMAEQYANKSFFFSGPVVSHSVEGLLPELQYNEYTTETAKQLGKLIGYTPLKYLGPENAKLNSPEVVDNYIRDWSGTLGAYAVQLADKALHAAGIGSQVSGPTSTLADIPVIKAFVIRYPSAKVQTIQDFYDKYNDNSRLVDSVKYLAKQGDVESAKALMQANPGSMDQMTSIRKALGQAEKAVHSINKDPATSPTDKRQLIDTIYYKMIQMAKAGNKQMDDFEKIAKEHKLQQNGSGE